MKVSRIALLVAAGLAFPAPVWAACSPTITGIPNGVSIDVKDCHLQIQNPPIVPITTGTINPGDPEPGPAGVEIIVRNSATGEVGSDGGVILDTVNKNAHTMTKNDAILDARTKDLDERAKTAKTKNDQQDGRLDAHDVAIGNHNDQIGELYSLNTGQQTTLNAHTALLSEHTARLDEHEKGLAIAMAMPDAWLSDKKHFGIFGSVGGFGDETAVGFAAIGRLDETFSLNAKFGSDTSFNEFGWQVGVGAQW
jgi:hypothetical protein